MAHRTTKIEMTYFPRTEVTDFAGIYVFGYNRPFTFEENKEPIESFYKFSKSQWPLYIFYAVAGEMEKVIEKYPKIVAIQISPMRSIDDYDDFMMRECFHIVNEENTLTFHQDGYLLKNGWEEFAQGYDYLGASWHRHIPNFDHHYKNNLFAKFKGYEKIRTNTTVGNGGFCFRRKSKMLEVEKSVDWQTRRGKQLPDDIFYSFYGFGQGILKPVSREIADQWSIEPLSCRRPHQRMPFGFHGK